MKPVSACRYSAIKNDYNALALEVQEDLTAQLPELPEQNTPTRECATVQPLLDTSREYMTQLAYYRQWQGKDGVE